MERVRGGRDSHGERNKRSKKLGESGDSDTAPAAAPAERLGRTLRTDSRGLNERSVSFCPHLSFSGVSGGFRESEPAVTLHHKERAEGKTTPRVCTCRYDSEGTREKAAGLPKHL